MNKRGGQEKEKRMREGKRKGEDRGGGRRREGKGGRGGERITISRR
jgi:hypothetical protein